MYNIRDPEQQKFKAYTSILIWFAQSKFIGTPLLTVRRVWEYVNVARGRFCAVLCASV
jgi:hypothetical protein